MNLILEKYKPFAIGLIIMIVLTAFLQWIGFIRINPTHVLENVFGFVIWWLIFSFIAYKVPTLKKKAIFKFVGLFLFLIVIIVIDATYGIPDSPVTIPLVVAFWLCLSYLIFRSFFEKYGKYIFGVYLFLVGYFLYVRLFSVDLETYMQDYKGTALFMLVIPIPFLLALWIYEQWKWLKILKTEKAEAELALLKSQINPHFFFNTLNNLHALTVKNSKKAPEVILKLSDMMRYSIYEGKKERVPLREEVEYLNNFIELHKLRHHKEVAINFEEEINGAPQISPLLFIILLENVFKHGVDSLMEGAFINMKLYADDQRIDFSIENNFDPEEVKENPGIGLENLKRRLELIYPNQYKFEISKKENIFSAQLNLEIA